MFTRRLLVTAATAALIGAAAPAYAAPVEIQWWHAMGGPLGEKLVSIAEGFNKSQSDYKVVPVFKGSYPEAMTGA
ncbi:ABC transporter substrate-binding protein, partial [Acinetobacter baumannii]